MGLFGWAREATGDRMGAVLARGAVGAFMIKLTGAMAVMGVQIFLARILGTQQYGVYVYVVFCLAILVLFAKMGLDMVVLRFVAAYRAREEWGLLRGLLRSSNRFALLCGVGVGALCAVVVAAIGERISSDLRLSFWIGCAVLPVMGLTMIRQAALRSLRLVIKASFMEFLMQPLFLAVLAGGLAVLCFAPLDAVTVMAAHFFAFLGALTMGSFWLARGLSRVVEHVPAETRNREWLAVGLPFVLMSGFFMINTRADVIMIGAFLGTTQAGIYSAAVRLSGVLLWGLMAVNVILAPMISHYHARKEGRELQRIVTLGARAIAAFTLPAGLVMVLAGRWLLLLFGSEFTLGYVPLLILIVGQFANALAGSVGYLMTMTGHQRDAAVVLGASAGLNVIMNALLIPAWGISGAATATAVSTVLWNIAMYILVRKRLSVEPTCFAAVRTDQ